MPFGNENHEFPLYICPKIIFELSTGDFLDGSFHSPFSFTVLRANDMTVYQILKVQFRNVPVQGDLLFHKKFLFKTQDITTKILTFSQF